MTFVVNYVGKEKSFSSKDHAIKFMDGLDCGSDLWFGVSTLLRSREKLADGSFEVTVYNYDSGPLKLGKSMVRIDIGMDDDECGERCLPMFTKMTPGVC